MEILFVASVLFFLLVAAFEPDVFFEPLSLETLRKKLRRKKLRLR